MNNLQIFDSPIEEANMKYYMFPENYPLFKAYKLEDPPGFTLNQPYFFGIQNMNNDYIESYEDEYGVIFEFVTTKPYKLVALDDKNTQTTLYTNAPQNIKTILENNYGYKTNLRDSVGEKDREFAIYLCSLGYDGYATNVMSTNFGGKFHMELLLCNAANGIKFVKQITSQSRKNSILEKAKIDKISQDLKDKRKKNNNSYSSVMKPSRSLFNDDDDNIIPKSNRTLFDDDDDMLPNSSTKKKLFGGKYKKKSSKTKKIKTRSNKIKSKKRKTRSKKPTSKK